MNPFSYLLQAIGVQHPDATQAPADGDITVTARPKLGMTNAQDAQPIPVGNRSQLQDIADNASNAPAHKGAFGQKGTLRDILGAVGDAFLMQSGHNAVYAPKRDQEKASDALVGFTQNPQAAFERLAAVNPELAGKLNDAYQTNQTRQTIAQGVASGKNDALYLQKMDKLSKLGSNLLAGTKSPEETAAAVTRLKGLAAALKVDPADLGINDSMSPEEIRAMALGNETPYQQAQVPIKQQNADAHTATAAAAQTNAGTNAGRLRETGRHNRVMEPIAQQNANSNSGKADAVQQNADTNEYSADIRNNRNVANGAAPAARKPTHARPALAQPGAPAVGYKNKYGLTYQGGDPNDRKNWK